MQRYFPEAVRLIDRGGFSDLKYAFLRLFFKLQISLGLLSPQKYAKRSHIFQTQYHAPHTRYGQDILIVPSLRFFHPDEHLENLSEPFKEVQQSHENTLTEQELLHFHP